MKIWHAWVGSGRFIVRAADAGEAVALARVAAEEYNETPERAYAHDAGAELLDSDGEPAVLDVDYS